MIKSKNRTTADNDLRHRVLIVDDEKDFVRSLKDILESRGYCVGNAHSLKSDCDKIKNFNAEVALLDIRLGQANGIDLIARLREVRPEIICVR